MDARVVVLLSGAIAAGKSSIASALVNDHCYLTIRSGSHLRTLAVLGGFDESRRGLQELGDRLDRETDYSWIIDDVAAPLIDGQETQRRWLLDCARKRRQVEHFRRRYPGQVFHVHLMAPEEELRRRYTERLAQGGEYLGGTPYDVAVQHPNELEARALASIADLVSNTQRVGSVERLLEALATFVLQSSSR